jgi:hypothetical protein
MSAPRTGPPVQIVCGEPTDEELAALIAVLAGLAGAAAAEPPVVRRVWADPAHRLRTPLRPGPGAWRISLRDREPH